MEAKFGPTIVIFATLIKFYILKINFHPMIIILEMLLLLLYMELYKERMEAKFGFTRVYIPLHYI